MNAPARLVQADEMARWDELVASHGGHVLQSYAWGELKLRHGWQVRRWIWNDDGIFRAGAQVLFRRLLPGMTVAYVPRGPVLATPEVGADSNGFLVALREMLQSSGAFLLKLEPNWLRADSCSRLLEKAGFQSTRETIQPPATIRVDLTREPEAILAGMKSKWRYNIRLSEKKGVTVRVGAEADIPTFYKLMRVTGVRDHFAIHSLEYYRDAFKQLSGAGAARLFVAEYLGKILAMIFVTAFGREAIYLYGASGNEHRNMMPNHALHWAAMQWAKSRGAEWYDLWGVPESAQASGNADAVLPDSLYQFKQGFGGEVVHYSGAWDHVYAQAPFALYRAARRLRRGVWG